jgi:glycosyltransferase involved in cell wall biosynthesis
MSERGFFRIKIAFMMPFFSIVIPTYNRATLLRPTLKSVLNQSFTDYEVILVDDGSTDETPQVVANEFGTDRKLIYIQKKNEERSIARNTGIAHAKGEFIVFFDSDDLMHSAHLQTLYEAIQEHPECDMFATKYDYNRGGAISYNEIKGMNGGFYDYRLLLRGNIFGVLVCIRKNLPDFQHFPPNFNILEDWIFNIANLKKNRQIYLIDKVTMTIIDHDFRTMKDNQKVIAARSKATAYLLENFEFSLEEKKILRGYGYKFYAIHEYIDGNRKAAIYHIKKAANLLGWDKSLILLLVKSVIGKSVIEKIELFKK